MFWNVHRRLLYFQLKIACILYIVSCNLYPVSYILSSILVLLLINIWCTLVSRFSSLIYNFHINLKILRYQEKGVCEKGMEGGKKGGMWEGDGGGRGREWEECPCTSLMTLNSESFSSNFQCLYKFCLKETLDGISSDPSKVFAKTKNWTTTKIFVHFRVKFVSRNSFKIVFFSQKFSATHFREILILFYFHFWWNIKKIWIFVKSFCVRMV